MNIALQPGKYVIAVSGGVDSMVLLDLAKNQSGVELIVAHYDHGIRPDSKLDRQFVQENAAQLGLAFDYENGELGPKASEATARKMRYSFLERVRQSSKAKAIVTAHHQDDVLETAILNILRGTNRKGLTSLESGATVIRPMLHLSKKDIRGYARDQGLKWREDSTNLDEKYLRNYIRRRLLTRFSAKDRTKLLNIIEHARNTNKELDSQLTLLMNIQPDIQDLNRTWFISLPHDVAKEFLASWLSLKKVGNYDKATLERVTVAAKVGKPGTLIDINSGVTLYLKKDSLALMGLER